MTAFLPANIPSTIQTIEQLVVWGMEILQTNFSEVNCVEFLDENGEPLPRRVIESNTFFYTALNPGEHRHSARISVKVRAEYKTTGRVWDHVATFGDTPIPVGMKAA